MSEFMQMVYPEGTIIARVVVHCAKESCLTKIGEYSLPLPEIYPEKLREVTCPQCSGRDFTIRAEWME